LGQEEFWRGLDQLLAEHRIVVDRLRGTRHPNHPEMIYPLDYGYLKGTSAGDGAEIDVWLGSSGDGSLTGILCTFDKIKKDAEIKLLVACSLEDVEAIIGFHSWMGTLHIPRPEDLP
jgi:inorganic pyrophosphatase